MKQLGILGAGGHAREVALTLDRVHRADPASPPLVGFFDRVEEPGGELMGLPVHPEARLGEHPGLGVIAALGDPALRRRVVEGLAARHPQLEWPVVVDPGALLERAEPDALPWGVVLEPGAVVFAGAIATVNVVLGAHAHLGRGAQLGHDCRVGPYAMVCPGAVLSGKVVLEAGVFVGAGATILEGLTVGAGAVIGAGACVIADVAAGETVVGVPARPVKR